MKCVICSKKQLCWFWLTCTVGFFYPFLMCEMFALLRNSVTFCSACWSFSHIDKRCNSMRFLSSLMQRFPNHGEDPRQPSLCLLEPVHFYCSALNRESLRRVSSPDSLQTFIALPTIMGQGRGVLFWPRRCRFQTRISLFSL